MFNAIIIVPTFMCMYMHKCLMLTQTDYSFKALKNVPH